MISFRQTINAPFIYNYFATFTKDLKTEAYSVRQARSRGRAKMQLLARLISCHMFCMALFIQSTSAVLLSLSLWSDTAELPSMAAENTTKTLLRSPFLIPAAAAPTSYVTMLSLFWETTKTGTQSLLARSRKEHILSSFPTFQPLPAVDICTPAYFTGDWAMPWNGTAKDLSGVTNNS